MRSLRRWISEAVRYLRDVRMYARSEGGFPPGHYLSPVPSPDEVVAYLASRKPPGRRLPAVDLDEEGQRALLLEYCDYYGDITFPETKEPSHRYYYDNGWFTYADGVFYHCFLRKFRPGRIVEVGSGFSTAALLDTVERIYPEWPAITCIEPHPDRLFEVLRKEDRPRIRLLERKVQDVPAEEILSLEPGDLLFVDSTHVVKCGSDVLYLLFEILPHLRPGVFVHFHDVFYPFDYPPEWLLRKWYWNENYFLRAFLSYNTEWRIVFFNTYAHLVFHDIIAERMPICMKNAGGSLYLQRRA